MLISLVNKLYNAGMSDSDLHDSNSISEGGGGFGTGEIKKQEVFNKFVDFMALPDPDKARLFGVAFDEKKGRYESIPSQKDFALKYGVTENTLVLWKKRKDFQSAVDSKQQEWGLDTVPNVMASLYRRCIKYGISTDVELFLAFYKGWDRKQVIKHVHEKFDMDDVRALIAPLPQEMQDKFHATIAEIISAARVHGSGTQV